MAGFGVGFEPAAGLFAAGFLVVACVSLAVDFELAFFLYFAVDFELEVVGDFFVLFFVSVFFVMV